MSEKASQLRIGIFVIVGVAILLGALFLFGIRSAFEPTYTLETYVSGNVDGLSVGSVVKLRGVTVGKVTEIGFSWNMYEVIQPAVVVVRFKVKQQDQPAKCVGRTSTRRSRPSSPAGCGPSSRGRGSRARASSRCRPWTRSSIRRSRFRGSPKYPYIPSAPSQFGQILASIDKTLHESREARHSAGRATVSTTTLASATRRSTDLAELDVKGISTGAVGRADRSRRPPSARSRGSIGDARTTLQSMKLGARGGERQPADRTTSTPGSPCSSTGSGPSTCGPSTTRWRERARRPSSLNEVLDELKRYPSGFLLGGAPPPAPGLEKEKKK